MTDELLEAWQSMALGWEARRFDCREAAYAIARQQMGKWTIRKKKHFGAYYRRLVNSSDWNHAYFTFVADLCMFKVLHGLYVRDWIIRN